MNDLRRIEEMQADAVCLEYKNALKDEALNRAANIFLANPDLQDRLRAIADSTPFAGV